MFLNECLALLNKVFTLNSDATQDSPAKGQLPFIKVTPTGHKLKYQPWINAYRCIIKSHMAELPADNMGLSVAGGELFHPVCLPVC